MSTEISVIKKAEQFKKHIADGIEQWTKAGEIVVSMIDDDGMTIDEICEHCGGAVNAGIISRFEQLGRRQILPQLLVSNYAAVKHMTRLSYSEQKRAIEGVPLVIVKDGGIDNLNVKAENLTPSQCRQVFDGSSIRSIPAQRAWIESERERIQGSSTPDVEGDYKAVGRRIVINRPCSLSQKDLVRMLSEISKD